MNLSADFSRITGKVKPMHGVGQPPNRGTDCQLFHYLTEAGIPYSRLHDAGGTLGGGLYVDVPNLFRDFDADENDPANYDFAFTDKLLTGLSDAGVEPFFRLGVAIENDYRLRSYRVFPPADPYKWASVCEHIVRHYNEGWANGFHLGITYWEIWNEPDNFEGEGLSPMWRGTAEEYYTLYEITANRLKAAFGDSIRVGGYASCGFYALDCDPNCDGNLIRTGKKYDQRYREEYFIEFMHGFFRHILSEEHRAPLDFFSWHTYSDVPTAVKQAEYIRRVMNRYGLESVPDILNEWNTTPSVPGRATPEAAAKAMAFLLAMQKQTVSEMNFYDARLGPSPYGGLFNPSEWTPYPAYYSFFAFGKTYRLGNEIFTQAEGEGIYAMGAADEKEKILLIANIGKETLLNLNLKGICEGKALLRRIDRSHAYTDKPEEFSGNTLILPSESCAELTFSE